MIDTDLGSSSNTQMADAVSDGRSLRNLVGEAAAGSSAAFSDIVRVIHPSVYRWALTFARDIDEAEEITQDTFVIVYRKLNQYRGESAFEGWVYLITRRIALQRARKNKRRRLLTEAAVPGLESVYNTDPGARVDRERIANYVRHFFTELPARQREIFDLVDLQGRDPSEVAEIIGMKPATVRANLFKARASIRAHLLANHPSWQEIHK